MAWNPLASAESNASSAPFSYWQGVRRLVTVQLLAHQLLFLLGCGFFVANLRVGRDLCRYWRARPRAVLIWPPSRPAFYRLSMLLGAIQGLLLSSLVLLKVPAPAIFGLAMMLVYFLAATPLSARIDRGFYETGVWADSGFVPWSQISSISWREDPVTLVVSSSARSIARHLRVPSGLYGEARKVLRDRIRLHGFLVHSTGLDLGTRDERDTV